MGSTWVYFQSDGSMGQAALRTHEQARSIAAPGSLFVYGGDVYDVGDDDDFAAFDDIYQGALPRVAAIPGNHDWITSGAKGFDDYWKARQPPASCTPIDGNQSGASKHHYTQPLGNDWLGIFIDCGEGATKPLTASALTQVEQWLTDHGSRRVIVFLHHARLSCGIHRDNVEFDPLWQACFNADGSPRVTAWVAGHNHNMGVYLPRAAGLDSTGRPPLSQQGISDGVQIFINGAGGERRYPLYCDNNSGDDGTRPDRFGNDLNFGFLQIEFDDPDTAVFQNYSTGHLGFDDAEPIGPEIKIQFS